MPKNLKVTIQVLIFWSIFMGMAPLLYNPMGYNYENAPLLLSTHFILTTLLGVKLFYPKGFKGLLKEYNIRLLLIIITIFFAIFSSINFFFPADTAKILAIQSKGVIFVSFSSKVITTKIFDIFFQQILSYLLIFHYLKTSNEKKSILYFTIFFGALHIPLLVIFGPVKGALFLFPSMFGGLVFAYLIVYKKFGKEWAIAVHYSFYVFLGIYLRYF